MPDCILSYVEGHDIWSAVEEKSLPMGANVCRLLVERVVIERKVRGHTDPRVDLVDKVARGITERVVDVYGVVEEEFGQPIFEQVNVRQIGLQLGNEDVNALGILCRQVVRPTIAGPHERKAVPVET